MADECLICGKPLQYFTQDKPMTCTLCGKTEPSTACCEAGHYVCNDCHTQGIDTVLSLCLAHKGTDPGVLLLQLMAQPFCHMHGPEHHILVGASLLTAYYHATGRKGLADALQQMLKRGRQVPGGACGFWGACGAGISAGMYLSILTGATPLKQDEWGLSNRVTAAALAAIGQVGGPRCCKRDSFLALRAAVDFTKEQFDVSLPLADYRCPYSSKNAQCIKARCPFYH